MLSSRSFIALGFTFRCIIHFELTFVKGVRSISRFSFYTWMSSCFSTVYCRDYLFSIFCLCIFVKDSSTIFMGVYFWALYSVPLIYLSLSQIQCCLNYCSFIGSLEVGEYQASNFVLLPQYGVGYFRSLFSSHKLQNQFVDIHKISCWNFDWNCTESTTQVEKN